MAGLKEVPADVFEALLSILSSWAITVFHKDTFPKCSNINFCNLGPKPWPGLWIISWLWGSVWTWGGVVIDSDVLALVQSLCFLLFSFHFFPAGLSLSLSCDTFLFFPYSVLSPIFLLFNEV